MESSLHWKCRREKPQISLFLNIIILQFRFSSSFENLLFLPCQTSQTSYCGSKMLYSYLCIGFWWGRGKLWCVACRFPWLQVSGGRVGSSVRLRQHSWSWKNQISSRKDFVCPAWSLAIAVPAMYMGYLIVEIFCSNRFFFLFVLITIFCLQLFALQNAYVNAIVNVSDLKQRVKVWKLEIIGASGRKISFKIILYV